MSPEIFTSSQPKPEKPTLLAAPSPIPTPISLFSSFCEYPLGVSFKNQTPDEKIVLFLRRHFATNLSWMVLLIILLLLPLALNTFIDRSASPFTFLPPALITIFTLFYYLCVFSYGLVNFMNWFYNITFITTKRIVDIDFSDLVYHDVATTMLSVVEDVNYTKTGFIRSLFNYGDLFVRTASDKSNFEAYAVPQPEHASDIIVSHIGRGRHGR